MILPPPEPPLFAFSYSGPVRGDNRRLAWNARAGRAFPDPLYRQFKAALALAAAAAHAGRPPILARLLVVLDVVLPARMDSTSLVKPTLDALQSAHVIRNDSQVWQLALRRLRHGDPYLSARLYPVHDLASPDPFEPADPRRCGPLAENIHTEDV